MHWCTKVEEREQSLSAVFENKLQNVWDGQKGCVRYREQTLLLQLENKIIVIVLRKK
jgi:hypothetical protein